MAIFRRLSAKFSRNHSSRNGVNGMPKVEESHSTTNNETLTATTRTTSNASTKASTNATSNGTPTLNGTSIAQSLDQTKQVKRSHPSYSSKPQPVPEDPNGHEGLLLRDRISKKSASSSHISFMSLENHCLLSQETVPISRRRSPQVSGLT